MPEYHSNVTRCGMVGYAIRPCADYRICLEMTQDELTQTRQFEDDQAAPFRATNVLERASVRSTVTVQPR